MEPSGVKRLRKARLDTAGVIGAALKDSAPLISTFFHGEIISSQQVRPRQQIDARHPVEVWQGLTVALGRVSSRRRTGS